MKTRHMKVRHMKSHLKKTGKKLAKKTREYLKKLQGKIKKL